MSRQPLYPHVPKGRKFSPPDEQRVTTMSDRFTIDCSYCGFLISERTFKEALETAGRLRLRHKARDEKIRYSTGWHRGERATRGISTVVA